MSRGDRVLREGAAAVLAVAARRGLPALEAALSRMTSRQRALVDPDYVAALRREAGGGYRVGDVHPSAGRVIP